MIIGLVGLPRCGKSTFAKRLQNEWRFFILNRDSIRLKVYGHRFFKGGEDFVRGVSKTMLQILFDQDINVVIDETNLTQYHRDEYEKLVKDQINWIYFNPTDKVIKTCRVRAIETNQNDLLPVIDGMIQSISAPEKHFLASANHLGEIINTSTSIYSSRVKDEGEFIEFMDHNAL